MTATKTDFKTPETYRFKRTEGTPNNRMPLLVYRTPLEGTGELETRLRARFARHGWTKAWVDTIYTYDHFHTTAHEVLGIAKGHAKVRFGGDEGEEIEVAAGDVIAIPAGVAHKRISGSTDLSVVGAYAQGHEYDMVRPEENDDAALTERRIARVPLPLADPLYGEEGPLKELWHKNAR